MAEKIYFERFVKRASNERAGKKGRELRNLRFT